MIITKRERIIAISPKTILGIANYGEEDFKIKKIDLSTSYDAEVEVYYVSVEFMQEMKDNTIIPYGENENVKIMSDVVLIERSEPIKNFVYRGNETIVTALDGLMVEPLYGIILRVKTYKENSIISTNIII